MGSGVDWISIKVRPLDTDRELDEDGFPVKLWRNVAIERWVDARGFQHDDYSHLDYCVWQRDLAEAVALCAIAVKDNRGYGRAEQLSDDAWELSEHPHGRVLSIGCVIVQDRDERQRILRVKGKSTN